MGCRVSRSERFAALFGLFDVNGDGRVDRQDLARYTAGVVAAVAPHDMENAEAIRAGFELTWEYLGRDLPHSDDVGLSLADFCDQLEKQILVDPMRFDASLFRTVVASVRALDTDRDGFITADQYARLFRGAGEDEAATARAWSKVDDDDDGRVLGLDFLAISREFFYSDDAQSASNALLQTKVDVIV